MRILNLFGRAKKDDPKETQSKAILDFYEKIFFDLHKREFDQEENIWKSMPFF